MHFLAAFFIIFLAANTAWSEDAGGQKLPVFKVPYPNKKHTLPFKFIQEIVRLKGGYRLSFSYREVEASSLPFSRVKRDFDNGDIDIIWTLSNSKYEKQYQAIHYPLYRGLFGYRVGIVKRENVDRFKQVHSLDDLRKFTAGQSNAWADTGILQHNQVPVIPVRKYSSHFPMLEGNRFDYFPRAIHEPWYELAQHKQFDLVVEPHILLRYKAPFYFFINKNNIKLKQYLEEGMELLVQNGSYERMFFADEHVEAGLKKAGLDKRVIIDLSNPYLSKQTPTQRPELWFDPLEPSGQQRRLAKP